MSYCPSIPTSLPRPTPFGSGINSRGYSAGKYRFGFNGKEEDGETAADAYDFGARIYDARLGRWLAVDPLFEKFTENSPYSSMGNNSIIIIDFDGQEIVIYYREKKGIGRLFEKKKEYTYKGDGTDQYTGNSKFLKESIKALDYLEDNDPTGTITKLINDKQNKVHLKKASPFTRSNGPAYYNSKNGILRWKPRLAQEFYTTDANGKETIDFVASPATVLFHELAHAYIKFYYTPEQKKELEKPELDQNEIEKWGIDREEREVVEKFEQPFERKVYGGKSRENYMQTVGDRRVQSSTSIE